MWQTTKTRNCLQTGRNSDLLMTQIIFRQFGTSLFVTLTQLSQMHLINTTHFLSFEIGTKQQAFLDCWKMPQMARIIILLPSFVFCYLLWLAHNRCKHSFWMRNSVAAEISLVQVLCVHKKTLETRLQKYTSNPHVQFFSPFWKYSKESCLLWRKTVWPWEMVYWVKLFYLWDREAYFKCMQFE